MRYLIVIYYLLLGLAALLAEMLVPSHFPLLGAIGFGSALIPLVVIGVSLELGDERAPVLAFILGFLLDLATDHRLGTSMLILCSISALIITQTSRPEAQLWFVKAAFLLVGTFAFEILDYLFALAESLRWAWPLEAWSKMTFASLLNLLLAVPFFFIARLPMRLLGWLANRRERPAERMYAR